MVTDPIADFINQIKNAGALGRESVSIPFSNMKLTIAEALKEKGFITSFDAKGKKVKRMLDVFLKYENGVHKIKGVKRISKPGRRMYRSAKEIVPVKYGHGALILSTPKGVMAGEDAKKISVGGEALFEIW